jgi:hypothetical protein
LTIQIEKQIGRTLNEEVDVSIVYLETLCRFVTKADDPESAITERSFADNRTNRPRTERPCVTAYKDSEKGKTFGSFVDEQIIPQGVGCWV